jgi:hypothetical protein
VAEAVTPVDEPAETPAPVEPAAVDAPVDAEARVVESEPIVIPPRRAERDWRRRFTLGFVLLGILAVGAFALLGGMIGRATEAAPPSWSPGFEPAGEGLDRAASIAGFIETRYRLADGNQLVTAFPGVPSYTVGNEDVPAAGFAIKRPAMAGGDNYEWLTADNTIQYVLCGLGQGCAIATGDPTPERERLVRREALELALYTFKYVKGIDRVATFLPPRAGSPATWMLLFQRDDYGDQLHHPVAQTLPDAVPPAEAIPADQVATIDGLTNPQRYRFEVQNLQNGQPIFVLEPAAA